MKRIVHCLSWILLTAGGASVPSLVFADQIRIAVASNFVPVAEQLAMVFDKNSEHTVVISGGASGALYTQISNGAPFDLFFSADSERPARLVRDNIAVPGTLFTYALGRIVLWSPTLPLADNAPATLEAATFDHLALANPRLAPYGKAARQVLEKLHLWDQLQGKLVLGENIAQTLQFVDSGNAELGFIALAQWQALPRERQASPWMVPAGLFDPITQDAVMLRDSAAARQFMSFMQSPAARSAIEQAGYALP